MKRAACETAIPLFLLLLAAAPAAPEEPEQYLVEYGASRTALDAGNTAGAVEHGHAAWQAAEQALGDHRLTAILAYNHGRLVVFTESENADAALQRSRDLMEAGIADLDPIEVNVYASYARFVARGKKRRDADRLREALTSVGLDTTAFNSDLAPMWLQLALDDVTDERYRTALKSGKMAEAAIRKLTPGLIHPLAQAIAIQGIAQLVPYSRNAEDIQAAHGQFMRAFELFPLQKDIDSFDPLFAEVYAWDAAAAAALKTLGADASGWYEGPLTLFSDQEGLENVCGPIEWQREAPDYPGDALDKGYLGAVFLGFRIGDDLRVSDARILAEVPKATFGAAVLEAAKNWRIPKIRDDLDPACTQNLTATYYFIIEE